MAQDRKTMNSRSDAPFITFSRFIGADAPEVSGHALEAELDSNERALLDRVADLSANDQERDHATRLLAGNATALDYLAARLTAVG